MEKNIIFKTKNDKNPPKIFGIFLILISLLIFVPYELKRSNDYAKY